MPVTKAHMKATGKYEAKAYDKILIRIRKDSDLTRDIITAAAEKTRESLNAYILQAVRERIEREESLGGIEEVLPDEWDLEMMERAEQENDGGTISFDELLKSEGLTYADLQN